MIPPTPKQINNYWSHVTKTDKCWIWQWEKLKYYRWYRDKKPFWLGIAQFSFYVTYGYLPAGGTLRRKCGNKRCVRPDHLRQTLFTPHEVRQIRREYLYGDMSALYLAKKYQCRRMQQILKNEIYYDPTYTPPPKVYRIPPTKKPKATIGNETKTLVQWSLDPRCEIALPRLENKYYHAHAHGKPITLNILKSGKKKQCPKTNQDLNQ